MSVYRDKTRGRFVFEFNRVIQFQRIRARKILPRTWNQAQADAFDRQETARLYALATNVERPDPGIEAAVHRYLRERVPKLKAAREITTELALMFWAYQGRPLSALADVCKAYASKTPDIKPATLRKRIRYLTSACRFGWKHHSMGVSDPGLGVVIPEVNNERQVYVNRAQMLQLARACPHKGVRAEVRIAFYSGMRLGEIKRAKWVNGNFELGTTKNGSPRTIPIHPKVRTCKIGNHSRFTTHHYFDMARVAVGLPWVHFHDLRHSAASAMINEGVDLYTVGAVLGHKSPTSTKRYAHLSTERLAEAVGKIGQNSSHPHPLKRVA